MADYLATIRIGGGSSHGRSSDKEEAISGCLRYFRDWESVFDIPEQDVQISVLDVEGYDRVVWDHEGFHGQPIAGGEFENIERAVEHVSRHFKPSKKKRR